MNIRTKTALITVATLIIGFSLGALVHPFQKDVRKKRTSHEIFEHLERVIQPQDSQKAAIGQLFAEYEKKLDRISSECRRRAHATLDSMRQELNPLLTSEQVARLEADVAKWRKAKKERKQDDENAAQKQKDRQQP